MTNRLSSLEIDIWDFIEIWCLEFEISEILPMIHSGTPGSRLNLFPDQPSPGQPGSRRPISTIRWAYFWRN